MKRKFSGAKPFLSIAILLAFLFLFIGGLNSVSGRSDAEQLRSLEEAVRRNIVHCYTVNGFYPESLDYLMEHYPILYDDTRYSIHYQPVASNLMPDVTVMERKQQK